MSSERKKKPLRRGICQSCHRDRKLHPRDLCHACYTDRKIREKFTVSPSAYEHGLYYNDYEVTPPSWDREDCRPEPTRVLAGPAKVEILIERARQGKVLWHPDDATHVEQLTPEEIAGIQDETYFPQRPGEKAASRGAAFIAKLRVTRHLGSRSPDRCPFD